MLQKKVNNTIQVYVGKVDTFKRSDTVGTSSWYGSADYMVLNKSLYVMSAITCVGWNLI